MKLKLPSATTTIIGLVLGGLVVLNNLVFHFGPPWVSGLNVLLVLAATFGVGVLTGPAFRAALQLTQAEMAAVASALGVVQLVLAQSGLDSGLRTALQAIVVVAGALGFETNTIPAVRHERREARL